MKYLVLGYSQIFKKRILPALVDLKAAQVDVATRSRKKDVSLPDSLKGKVYYDYEEALEKSNADIVYVSTVNSLHEKWAELALRKMFHVVVDKPAFSDLETSIRITNLARSQGLCLAESTVYAYHPQIAKASDIFKAAGSRVTQIVSIFSFPPLSDDNFRYYKNLGGGALKDTGCYALTPGRLFFREMPKEVVGSIIEHNGKVETSYSFLAKYSQGRSLVGHFGFTTGYMNKIELLGPDVTVSMDRVFSIPAKDEAKLKLNVKNNHLTESVEPSDCFTEFLSLVEESIHVGDFESFLKDLLLDAESQEILIQSCSV